MNRLRQRQLREGEQEFGGPCASKSPFGDMRRVGQNAGTGDRGHGASMRT